MAKKLVKVTKACICDKCEGVVKEEVIKLPYETVIKYVEEGDNNFFKYEDKHRQTDYRQLVTARHAFC